MRNIAVEWLHKAAALQTGQELYFPAENKQTQKDLFKLFIRELRVFSQIDAVLASTIVVAPTFKDKRHWVVLRKIAAIPTLAFMKDDHGVIQRVSIADDSDRIHRLELMIKEGYSLEKMEEIEGKLDELTLRRIGL
jgi:hypothetical protein